jgi:putative oxidoreductase
VAAIVQQVALPALRTSLGLVFLWFGALKLTGESPVRDLIAATLPWVSPGVAVPALGAVEIALGVAVLSGWKPRSTMLALVGYLGGTFLTFVVAPQLMMGHNNPLLLTAYGEFVLKNLVLMSAGLVLMYHVTLPSADARQADPAPSRPDQSAVPAGSQAFARRVDRT